jgi:prohibitin 2
MSGPTPAQAAQAINNILKMAQVAIFGGLTVYGVSHSIFNVEGGHRAVVFNRLVGIKDTVGGIICAASRSPRSQT